MSKVCVECVFIEIACANAPNIIVGSMYRPPGADVSDFNSEILDILTAVNVSKSKLIIIAGDYNLDLLKAESHVSTGEFLNLLFSYSFMPMIRYPTRITETSATLIDNIFVNKLYDITDSAIIYSDISDHLPVIVCVETVSTRKHTVNAMLKRIYSIEQYNNFNQSLASTDWSDVYINCIHDNPTKSYSIFIATFDTLFNKFFPLTPCKMSYRKTPRTPWITPALIKSCNKKNALYRSWIKTPSSSARLRYTKYRNRLKGLLQAAQKLYYATKFKLCAGNLRQTWKLLLSTLNKKKLKSIIGSF